MMIFIIILAVPLNFKFIHVHYFDGNKNLRYGIAVKEILHS